MIKVVEGWHMLPSKKSDELWDEFERWCKFSPSIEVDREAFSPNVEYDIYDCVNAISKAENDADWSKVIRSIFTKTKGVDEYIYALDWQHSEFRYIPEIDKGEVNKSYFVGDEGEEFNVYLPKFYPDGEYYLFLAKDFKWGYLTDPWRQQIIVYGDELRNEISKNSDFLEISLVETRS